MRRKTFGSSSTATMVDFLVISIFLLPIVTASSDDFWYDVDMMDIDLSDPEDLTTYAPISVDQLVAPMPEIPQHSSTSNENQYNYIDRRRSLTVKFFPKFVTLRSPDVEIFTKKIIVDEAYPQDISFTEIEDKLLALGSKKIILWCKDFQVIVIHSMIAAFHDWYALQTYEVDKYPKYWAKVCVMFWGKPLVRSQRIACTVSRSYANNTKQMLNIRKKKQYIDLLCCRCYTYLTNSKIPSSTTDKFLIHKGDENEFFIFEENESEDRISIKGFKNGITLPYPSDFERCTSSSVKFIPKVVRLKADEMVMFIQGLSINRSYPKNVSMEELERKLMELEEIHAWPDLLKHDHYIYTRYWAKVCVLFRGKELDSKYRHVCTIYPSLGDNKLRKLFIRDRSQYFDLLYCKCHSYVTNIKIPVSGPDTFLIHQISANEFFIFEQHPTENTTFTLFIKDFKGGITLPNPEYFN